MMRGPKEYAVAVRKPDGEIELKKSDVNSIIAKSKILKLPIIRGVISFFESLVVGMKCLMFSADLFDVEVEESKFDKWLDEKLGDKAKDVAVYISVIIAILMSIGLFMLLPAFLAGLAFKNEGETRLWFNLLEGVVRIAIFMGYIILISRMPDIQRVFEYHGAEHKTIFCYEAEEELTVENVKKHPRFHPRCGTSFLLIVMVMAILVFSLVPSSTVWMTLLERIILIPLVAGLSYEIIKFAGRSENKVVCLLNKPGLWFQRFTTREPDDSQIEVAIEALKNVMPENREDAKW
ncbi:MAG: DUF1385 domain-containing protein [Clostridia bacterium]|nr:DUF1385 domain-containing protein [Clostridia bacterium]